MNAKKEARYKESLPDPLVPKVLKYTRRLFLGLTFIVTSHIYVFHYTGAGDRLRKVFKESEKVEIDQNFPKNLLSFLIKINIPSEEMDDPADLKQTL